MTFKKLSALLGCITLALILPGCGNGASLSSILITPTSPNLQGIGGTQQFKVVATYSDGNTRDVTLQTSYSIASPNPPGPATPDGAFTITADGLAQVVLGACTWTSNGATPPVVGTDPYILTASYGGKQNTAFVSVSSLAGCPG